MLQQKQWAPQNPLPLQTEGLRFDGGGLGRGWPYFRERHIGPPAFDLCRGLWLIAASLEGGSLEQTE